MWVVAVRAGHTCRVHTALQKRGVRIDLVALLAVDMIEARIDERRAEGIKKLSRLCGIVRELVPPGMASGTGFDLLVGRADLGTAGRASSVASTT